MTFDWVAWREWRRHGIGASDVAAIVGLSPWQSAYSLWAEKVGLIDAEQESDAMAHGRYAEHAIRAWWVDTFPELIPINEQTWCQHPDFPWARTTPDGFLVDSSATRWQPGEVPDDAVGLIEYKVADFRRWEEIPDHYQCQAQYQMFVTGQTNVAFAVMHGKRFERYDLERNDDDIDFLRDAADLFWYEYVVAGVAPTVDGHVATSRALNHRWQASDNTIDFDDDLAKVHAELINARVELDWWDERKTALENELKAAMGDATVARVGGKVACTWKPSTTSKIDVKRLRAEQPEIATQYSTVTEGRRFLPKEVK